MTKWSKFQLLKTQSGLYSPGLLNGLPTAVQDGLPLALLTCYADIKNWWSRAWKGKSPQVWWFTPDLSALGRPRQDDQFKASLSSIVRLYLKTQQKGKTKGAISPVFAPVLFQKRPNSFQLPFGFMQWQQGRTVSDHPWVSPSSPNLPAFVVGTETYKQWHTQRYCLFYSFSKCTHLGPSAQYRTLPSWNILCLISHPQQSLFWLLSQFCLTLNYINRTMWIYSSVSSDLSMLCVPLVCSLIVPPCVYPSSCPWTSGLSAVFIRYQE